MIARSTSVTLADALAARGVVCLTGAGGKKSTMYALAQHCRGRIALSSTSHMYRYDPARVDRVVSVAPGAAPGDPGGRVVAYAGPSATAARVGGLDFAQLRALWALGRFDVLILKADGARGRWLKAPAAHEPVVPPFADTVIPVLSIRVLGRTLDSGIAHRPERAAAVMGVALDEPLVAEHLARLLASTDGALRGVGTARVVPLINMVDDDVLQAAALAVAHAALARTQRFDRVVLGSMRETRVVRLVERTGTLSSRPPVPWPR